jgi:hypothetical protein
VSVGFDEQVGRGLVVGVFGSGRLQQEAGAEGVLGADQRGVQGADGGGGVGEDGGGEVRVARGEAAEVDGDAVVLGGVGRVEDGGDVLCVV